MFFNVKFIFLQFYQDTLETEEDKEDKMKLRSSNKKVKLDEDDDLKDNVEDNGGTNFHFFFIFFIQKTFFIQIFFFN